METTDPRLARATALAAARGRLARLKVAALSGSLLAFGGMSAGLAMQTASRVVATSTTSAMATIVPVANTAATPAAAGAPVPAATATPTAAPTAAATTPKKAAPIVSAQS